MEIFQRKGTNGPAECVDLAVNRRPKMSMHVRHSLLSQEQVYVGHVRSTEQLVIYTLHQFDLTRREVASKLGPFRFFCFEGPFVTFVR
jgi:hypothetical protein